MLEARLEGMQPVAVTAHGDTIQEALKGALGKLKSSLDTTLGVCKNIKKFTFLKFNSTAAFSSRFRLVLT